MYKILGILSLIILGIVFVVKLLRNSRYDKFCKDLFSGKLDTDSTTKDTIKDITSAEKDLSSKSDDNIKEAARLKKESKGIDNFLGNRGVKKTEKGEDS